MFGFSAAVESTGAAKAEAQSRAEAARIQGEAAVNEAKLKAEAQTIEAVRAPHRQTSPPQVFKCANDGFEQELLLHTHSSAHISLGSDHVPTFGLNVCLNLTYDFTLSRVKVNVRTLLPSPVVPLVQSQFSFFKSFSLHFQTGTFLVPEWSLGCGFILLWIFPKLMNTNENLLELG